MGEVGSLFISAGGNNIEGEDTLSSNDEDEDEDGLDIVLDHNGDLL